MNKSKKARTLKKKLERLGHTVVEECPGVFYLCTPVGGEWYIVRRDTPEISSQAKTYGRPVKNDPGLLSYSFHDNPGSWGIILYEILKYRVKHHIPVGNHALRNMAVVQASLHPEYFGTYPAPLLTPWGHTLRNKMLLNGLYFLETDQCVRTLAVCYSLWRADLTSDTLALAKKNACDEQEGSEATQGYLFFSEEDSCLPLHELMSAHPDWDTSELIIDSVLKNALAKRRLGYVHSHQEVEQRKQQRKRKGIFLWRRSVEEPENTRRDFLAFWK